MLVLKQHLNEEGENIGGAIVDHIEIAANWLINAIVEELVELERAVFHLFFEALDPLVELLVWGRALH